MLKILLVDDEPLVLIGLQGMLEWESLGYTVCATARNGRQALELIESEKPDIVIADVKMPVMDGLELARVCRERGALPAFIILTSFEEFDYVRRAMGAGAVAYLVKLELTPESLKAALADAAERVKKEHALLGTVLAGPESADGLRSYQDRFFVRLYGGLYKDEAELAEPLGHMDFKRAGLYVLAGCELRAEGAPPSAEAKVKLGFSCAKMLETTLKNYMPCYVTNGDIMRCSVLFCMDEAAGETYREALSPLLKKAGQILYNYFTVRPLWVVGRPTASLLGLAARYRENERLRPLLSDENPLIFADAAEDDAAAAKMQTVSEVEAYIRAHLSERLALADVAAVFNISPNYLSQLFGKYGDAGFVEYITEARVAAAREMLEKGDKKVYEIAEDLGFESSFYFSKVFKKVTGLSPREYQQGLK